MKTLMPTVLSLFAILISSFALIRDSGLSAQKQPEPAAKEDDTRVADNIRAKSIAILNDSGEVVISLTSSAEGQPEIRLYDSHGVLTRALMSVTKEGSSALSFFDEKGSGRLGIFASPNGRSGFELASGEKGAESEIGGLYRETDGSPMLLLRDPNGVLRLLHMVSGGASGTVLYNKDGKDRVVQAVDKNGVASHEILGVGGESIYRISAEKKTADKSSDKDK